MLGVDGVELESKQEAFAFNSAITTVDGTHPNRGDHWAFDNHYWLNLGGTEYDTLFGDVVDKSKWSNRIG